MDVLIVFLHYARRSKTNFDCRRLMVQDKNNDVERQLVLPDPFLQRFYALFIAINAWLILCLL